MGIALFYEGAKRIQRRDDNVSYLVVLRPDGGSLGYYFAAAWQQEPKGVKTLDEFRQGLGIGRRKTRQSRSSEFLGGRQDRIFYKKGSTVKKEFVHRNFLLTTKRAETLYHDYAEAMPIIDYHCHLSPQEIAENRQFENLTQVWVDGDHYKWRAMRTCGVDERFVTGDASDWEKFQKWAETVPKTLRNPLYHWTHLELKRPFGIS